MRSRLGIDGFGVGFAPRLNARGQHAHAPHRLGVTSVCLRLSKGAALLLTRFGEWSGRSPLIGEGYEEQKQRPAGGNEGEQWMNEKDDQDIGRRGREVDQLRQNRAVQEAPDLGQIGEGLRLGAWRSRPLAN